MFRKLKIHSIKQVNHSFWALYQLIKHFTIPNTSYNINKALLGITYNLQILYSTKLVCFYLYQVYIIFSSNTEYTICLCMSLYDMTWG